MKNLHPNSPAPVLAQSFVSFFCASTTLGRNCSFFFAKGSTCVPIRALKSCPNLTCYHPVPVLRPGTQCHTGCVHTLLPYFGTTTSSVIRYSEFRTKSSLCTMSARVRVSRFPLWWRRQSKNNSSRNSAAEPWRHCAVGRGANSIYWGRRRPRRRWLKDTATLLKWLFHYF